MKNKSRTCSTGHDTGLVYRRGLHESLQLDRMRKAHKRKARSERRAERLKRGGIA